MGTIIKQRTYSYNDLTIVPTMSSICSRSECDPFIEEADGKKMLPLFTAPMDTVVSEDNFMLWKDNHITPILPRTIHFKIRYEYMLKGEWVAVSLSEFKQMFESNEWVSHKEKHLNLNVCIDIANGHMQKMYEDVSEIKNNMKYKYNVNITIMIGNIANPRSYFFIANNYSDVIDYVRISIGSGNGCTTTSNTGVHYPIASLIEGCVKHRDEFKEYGAKFPKIIADGGVRNYDDAIKALALGADYVMIGSLFSSFLESAAVLNNISYDWRSNTEEEKRVFLRYTLSHQLIYKEFYGMSTKKAQAKIIENSIDGITKHDVVSDNTKLKTSEGCMKLMKCEYTINQWVDNFISYIRSAMSYTGSRTLETFRNAFLIENSQSEIMAVNS